LEASRISVLACFRVDLAPRTAHSMDKEAFKDVVPGISQLLPRLSNMVCAFVELFSVIIQRDGLLTWRLTRPCATALRALGNYIFGIASHGVPLSPAHTNATANCNQLTAGRGGRGCGRGVRVVAVAAGGQGGVLGVLSCHGRKYRTGHVSSMEWRKGLWLSVGADVC